MTDANYMKHSARARAEAEAEGGMAFDGRPYDMVDWEYEASLPFWQQYVYASPFLAWLHRSGIFVAFSGASSAMFWGYGQRLVIKEPGWSEQVLAGEVEPQAARTDVAPADHPDDMVPDSDQLRARDPRPD